MLLTIKREFDFALRICAYLAHHYKRGPIPISAMSRKLLITRPFATKIVYQLKTGGIVATVQGKEGGVYLNHNPERLTLMSILQGLGPVITTNDCVQDPTFCPLPPTCAIHSFFIDMEEEIIHRLSNRTIAEFAFSDADFDPRKSPPDPAG